MPFLVSALLFYPPSATCSSSLFYYLSICSFFFVSLLLSSCILLSLLLYLFFSLLLPLFPLFFFSFSLLSVNTRRFRRNGGREKNESGGENMWMMQEIMNVQMTYASTLKWKKARCKRECVSPSTHSVDVPSAPCR